MPQDLHICNNESSRNMLVQGPKPNCINMLVYCKIVSMRLIINGKQTVNVGLKKYDVHGRS